MLKKIEDAMFQREKQSYWMLFFRNEKGVGKAIRVDDKSKEESARLMYEKIKDQKITFLDKDEKVKE